MTVDWTALTRDFDPNDLAHRPGPGNRTLTYVDWHTIAARFDEVLTPAGWAFEVPQVAPDQKWAMGRLTIRDGETSIVRENIGYCENPEEPGKSAVSDCFKRCAAYFGVARYLYDKDRPQNGPRRAQTAPDAPQRESVTMTAAKPVLVAVGAPEVNEDDWQGLIAEPTGSIQGRGAVPSNGTGTPTCPIHKWEMKPGKKGGYYCSGKLPDGSWCKERVA